MQKIEITLSDGSVVEMRRPKVKDTLAVAKIDNVGEQEVALIANLTMQTVDDVSELYLDDYALLQAELKRFLSPAKKKS